MPTAIPIRPAPERCLSWPDTARLLILVARVRILDLEMHTVVRHGSGFADDRLLHLMRRWLAQHEAISALLPGVAEPRHVAEVRAILQVPNSRPEPEDRRAL
ncbi:MULTISPECIES: hypothetical protein [Methylobacterium]|uniref:hypothetical protein n=1 Tax=Methylobacterium TaxID=407 RepID=UPI00034B7BED|nr:MULTISPECIES: hypothetical protein [Methylobacterium]MBN4098595.1 hypothetical protein [Methylobacterium sp. OT2]UIN38476.1 hypothetical protein LXM90_31750 [Methylobacterium oryzae]